MITDFLMGVIFGLAQAFIDLLPEWAPPAEAMDEATMTGSYTSTANGYFPVVILAVCLLAIVGYRVVLTLWRLVLFIYEHFPFKAT